MDGGGHLPATDPSAEAGVPLGASLGEDLERCLWSLEAGSLPSSPGLGGKKPAGEPLWGSGILSSEWDLLSDLTGSDRPAAASNQSIHDINQVGVC